MKIAIFGAGGHGKVVADAVLTEGRDQLVGFFDDDFSQHSAGIFGYPVLGSTADWHDHAIDAFVLAIGDNAARKRQFERLSSAGASLAKVVHPRSTIGRGVQIGRGTVILAHVVINCDSIVGDNCILNTGSTIDHDCKIGDHVHIAPGSSLGGGISIGEGAFAGIGAKIIPRTRVGDWAVVGAGAVVIRDVSAGEKVVGVPARRI